MSKSSFTLELDCEVEYSYEPAHRERAFGDHGQLLTVSKEFVTIESVTVPGRDGQPPIDITHLLGPNEIDGIAEDILADIKAEAIEARAEAAEERRSGLFDFAVETARGQFR
jgi:hypothetical protein